MGSRKDKCPKCKEDRRLTRHHVFPARHFGKGKKNREYFMLCRQCHSELEKLIPFGLCSRKFYHEVINKFIGEEVYHVEQNESHYQYSNWWC